MTYPGDKLEKNQGVLSTHGTGHQSAVQWLALHPHQFFSSCATEQLLGRAALPCSAPHPHYTLKGGGTEWDLMGEGVESVWGHPLSKAKISACGYNHYSLQPSTLAALLSCFRNV